MIIQCEQCNTKFRLDDSKVTDKGVKVRCAKCRNVFTVRKESVEPEAQPDLDAMFTQSPSDFGALLDRSATFDAGEPPATPAPQAPAAATAAPEPGFDYSDFVSSDFDQEAGGGTPGFEPPGDEAAPVSAPGGADFGFRLPEGEQGFEPEHGETRAPGGEVDFGGFDFGGGTADAGTAVGAAPAEFDFRDLRMDQPSAETPAGGAADAGTFDFGDLALEPSQEPVSAPGTGEAAPFGFGGGAAFGEVPPAPPVEEAAEPGAGESLDLGEVGFGAGQAARPAAQEAPPEPESLQTPARQPAEPREEQPEAEAGEEPGEGSTMEVPQAGMEELPPLSITSRRRQSPLFGVLIAVVAVVAVAVLGFFGYTMFLEDKGKVVTEAGRITVRGVNASFVKNPVVGELLVITGEAVNTFAKPRAAIQIRGMVYGAGGQILASKNAYCGNPLTKEQLSTLPLDKIEAAMANQFGDSLANMEVAPGKAIPFVIVIPKPPAEGKDYGVEPAGSTVATGKLQ